MRVFLRNHERSWCSARPEPAVMTTVVIQRVVPHYRVPLFEQLHRRFGWVVACARSLPSGIDLKKADLAEWMRPFDFVWPNPQNSRRVNVPVQEILAVTGARAVIAEGSLQMSSTRELPLLRWRRGGFRLLFWSHGWNMDRGFRSSVDLLSQFTRLVPFRLADGHICYSQEGADYLRRFLSEERIFVCRNTIDMKPLLDAARLARPCRTVGPHLLFIGRLNHDKEVPKLVRMFRLLRLRRPTAVLTIIGEGPDQEAVRREAAPPGDAVRMVGAVYDDAQLASYFAEADIMVYAGAVGLAVNHALGYGVPVVAYERSREGPFHHPEIAYVRDHATGWRVQDHSEEAMAELIDSLFQDQVSPKLRLARSIRAFVESNLLLEHYVDDFERVDAFIRRIA
jgi:glycosyltransferase involved in cell wall biosynthesis